MSVFYLLYRPLKTQLSSHGIIFHHQSQEKGIVVSRQIFRAPGFRNFRGPLPRYVANAPIAGFPMKLRHPAVFKICLIASDNPFSCVIISMSSPSIICHVIRFRRKLARHPDLGFSCSVKLRRKIRMLSAQATILGGRIVAGSGET